VFKLISKDAWRVIEETIAAQREDLRKSQERIDRLCEALSRKEGLSLVMPQAPMPTVLEKSPGWFDVKPIPVIQSSLSTGEKRK
jgi:hypothetical protein